MQIFLASDVVYSQRVAPLIVQALDETGIKGQTIPESKSLPGYTWLAPDTVAEGDRRHAPAAARRTGGSSCPEGTACGHGLDQHVDRRHDPRGRARRRPCPRRRPSSST